MTSSNLVNFLKGKGEKLEIHQFGVELFRVSDSVWGELVDSWLKSRPDFFYMGLLYSNSEGFFETYYSNTSGAICGVRVLAGEGSLQGLAKLAGVWSLVIWDLAENEALRSINLNQNFDEVPQWRA